MGLQFWSRPGPGELLQQGFGVEGAEGGGVGQQAREQAGGVGHRETASSDAPNRPILPGDLNIFATSRELHHMFGAPEQGLGIVAAGEGDGDHRGEMARQFALVEIKIVRGGHDVRPHRGFDSRP